VKIEVVFHFAKRIEVVFHFAKRIEVVFHFAEIVVVEISSVYTTSSDRRLAG
jgi:hypothetical protein